MAWTREAGGYWIGPDGVLIKAPAHSPVAFDILVNLEMPEAAEKKPTIVETPGGPEVQEKGKSGEEAKGEAMTELLKRFDPNSPKTSNYLRDQYGYIRVVTDAKIVGIDARNIDDIANAEEALRKIISKNPASVSTGDGYRFRIDPEDMDRPEPFAEVLRDLAYRSKMSKSLLDFYSLGIWGALKSRAVSYFRGRKI